MLSERVLNTIKFFNLQQYPLTGFEVWQYLVADLTELKKNLDESYELPNNIAYSKPSAVHLDTVLNQLQNLVKEDQLGHKYGFYFLPGQDALVAQRLNNYHYGLVREKLIRRWLGFAKHVPFIRGISLAGSQALGLARPTSDIDLLIITDSKFMWLGRIFLTAYFQLTGVRRYGNKIANRFCLNHYLANIREVDVEKNLYKAMEYTKLRPVVYPQATLAFQQINQAWINMFFPNVNFDIVSLQNQSGFQKIIEAIFQNSVGYWLEKKLGAMQLARIKQEKYIFVKTDELSFHPGSKHEALLKGLFEV
jgi:predicted nucleotidyltransferase